MAMANINATARGLLLYLTTLLPGITPPLIINNTSKATVLVQTAAYILIILTDY